MLKNTQNTTFIRLGMSCKWTVPLLCRLRSSEHAVTNRNYLFLLHDQFTNGWHFGKSNGDVTHDGRPRLVKVNPTVVRFVRRAQKLEERFECRSPKFAHINTHLHGIMNAVGSSDVRCVLVEALARCVYSSLLTAQTTLWLSDSLISNSQASRLRLASEYFLNKELKIT